MQERADHEILVLDTVLDDERSDRDKVRQVRNRSALTRLLGMDRAGVRDRLVESLRQVQATPRSFTAGGACAEPV